MPIDAFDALQHERWRSQKASLKKKIDRVSLSSNSVSLLGKFPDRGPARNTPEI
jgi:hypothetical protein